MSFPILATSLIDAAIPFALGLLVVLFPRWFYRPPATMQPEEAAKRLKFGRVLGAILMGVGVLYALLSFAERR